MQVKFRTGRERRNKDERQGGGRKEERDAGRIRRVEIDRQREGTLWLRGCAPSGEVFDNPGDAQENVIEVVKHFACREPNQRYAPVFESTLTNSVVDRCSVGFVGDAVDFNDESERTAVEVDDVVQKDVLAPKFSP